MLRGMLLLIATMGVPTALLGPVTQSLLGQQSQFNQKVGKPLYAAQVRSSNNWAGYVDVAKVGYAFSTVTGSWQVPAVTGAEQSAAAQWIGLGGVRYHALLQMGTVETIENGQPVNTLFWEKLPQSAHDWVSVPAGATVTATIQPSSVQSGMFELRAVITSNGKSQTYVKQVAVAPTYMRQMESSAEWISEDPSDQNMNLVPLANMGTIHFQNTRANGQPITQNDARTQRMALISNDGQSILIQTSALAVNSTSFTTFPGATSGSNTLSSGTYPAGSLPVLPFPDTSSAVPSDGDGDGGGGQGGLPTWQPLGQWPSWSGHEHWRQLRSQLQTQLQQQLQNAFGQGGPSWQVQVQSTLPSIQQKISQEFQQAGQLWHALWSGVFGWNTQAPSGTQAAPVQGAVVEPTQSQNWNWLKHILHL